MNLHLGVSLLPDEAVWYPVWAYRHLFTSVAVYFAKAVPYHGKKITMCEYDATLAPCICDVTNALQKSFLCRTSDMKDKK